MDTMNKIVDDYLEYLRVQKNYSPLTIQSYKREIDEFKAYLIQEEIEDFINYKYETN